MPRLFNCEEMQDEFCGIKYNKFTKSFKSMK